MGNSYQSVPREIARADYIAAIEGLGFVASDAKMLTMHHDYIEACMFEKRDDGSRILDPERQDQFVKYCVRIPVIDDKESL